jgi:hypothetical protein
MQLANLLESGADMDVVPSESDVVSSICQGLLRFGHSEAVFVAHSLGNNAIAWMLGDPVAKSFVNSTVMVDPINFLLCEPSVATSVVYRDPDRSTSDPCDGSVMYFLIHFFVARELMIANLLSRHFQWSHNILFSEDLPGLSKNTDHHPNPLDLVLGVHRDCQGTGVISTRKEQTSCFLSLNAEVENAVTLLLDSERGLPCPDLVAQGIRVVRGQSQNPDPNPDLRNLQLDGLHTTQLAWIDEDDDIAQMYNGAVERISEGHSKNSEAEQEAMVKPRYPQNSIFLSSRDKIVPSAAVQRYFEVKARVGQEHVECFELDVEHGEILLSLAGVRRISQSIRVHCGIQGSHGST